MEVGVGAGITVTFDAAATIETVELAVAGTVAATEEATAFEIGMLAFRALDSQRSGLSVLAGLVYEADCRFR